MPSEITWIVVDIINAEGQWVVYRIKMVLSARVIRLIESYQYHLNTNALDHQVWKCNTDGIITPRSMYKFLTTIDDSNRDSKEMDFGLET